MKIYDTCFMSDGIEDIGIVLEDSKGKIHDSRGLTEDGVITILNAMQNEQSGIHAKWIDTEVFKAKTKYSEHQQYCSYLRRFNGITPDFKIREGMFLTEIQSQEGILFFLLREKDSAYWVCPELVSGNHTIETEDLRKIYSMLNGR